MMMELLRSQLSFKGADLLVKLSEFNFGTLVQQVSTYYLQYTGPGIVPLS